MRRSTGRTTNPDAFAVPSAAVACRWRGIIGLIPILIVRDALIGRWLGEGLTIEAVLDLGCDPRYGYGRVR